MSIEQALFWGQQSITTILLLAGPIMLAALVVGTVISLLQAMTQVQEMTLVFVPKILSVFLVTLMLGGWMLEQAVTFGTAAFESIATEQE
ncbi:MAG: flagellar biosynthetic protein FliQ [Pseudomonadota bacterium]